MQDPSFGVAAQLQQHVHLISNHRYPLNPALNLDQAYRYLTEAPTVVKQVAPMAWKYVQAPQDGTVWLEWISPRQGEYRFASDGYVWGDPEMSRREDFGGYSIEILSHAVGYRPQYDQLTTHARTRYHLVAKHPNANAPPPDPNLWLVHYHQTDRSRFMQAGTLPVHPQMKHTVNERRWLESLGRIENKDFMLHDRDHWPQVTLPGQMPPQQGGYTGMNPMMASQQQMPHARHPSYPFVQNAGQGPPAKRPRHTGPSGPPGSSDGAADTSIEDEENVALGDYFDHLTQRDISTARYTQHHRWMEEIFSSPYASSHIVPPDLGLGLMGALKGLTEGILEPPSIDEVKSAAPKPPKAKEAARFTNLKKEQVEEFNSRVQKHLNDGQAEIERMKKEHTEKMAEFNKGSVLMQAEKRLRTATWQDRAEVDYAFRFDGIADDDRSRETVEDIIKDIESSLNVRITGYDNITMREKGGLREKTDQLPTDVFASGQKEARSQSMEQSQIGDANGGVFAERDTSQNGQGAATATQAEALQSKLPSDIPQPDFQGGQQPPMSTQAVQQPGQPGQQQQTALDQDDMFGENGDMADTSMMESMAMDVDVENGGIDTSNIDFADDPPTSMPAQSAPQLTAPAAASASTAQALPSDPSASTEQAQAIATSTTGASASPAVTVPATTTQSAAAGGDGSLFDTTADADGAGDFNDTTFDDLANIDDNAGDVGGGLADFDGFAMDDSAFEGAMHGMDDPADIGGGGGGQDENVGGG